MTNPLPNHLDLERRIERCPGAIGCQNINVQSQPQTQTGAFNDAVSQRIAPSILFPHIEMKPSQRRRLDAISVTD